MLIYGNESITVHRKTYSDTTDDYGRTITTETSHVINDVLSAVGASTSNRGLTDHDLNIAFTLHLPHGSDVRSDDVIEFRGRKFTINGQPQETVLAQGMHLIPPTIYIEIVAVV